jgi:hypothetical protein
MKKWTDIRRLVKIIFYNVVVPIFFGWALFHFFSSAVGSANPALATIYWSLALVTILGSVISMSPSMAKRIGKEIVRRFACSFFPNSRFSRPAHSYTRARQFVAEKKYDVAIAAF